tara:strand:+ start:373284 stop:374270 length:987 start_codon:yes stop_codon:yes gene_type:complete
MVRIFLCVIVLCISSLPVAAGETPELLCLSGETVNEIFSSRLRKSGRNFLVIVGEGAYKSGIDADTWERSIWNDPEFAQYLKEKKLSVTYMDGESDPAFFSTLEISSIPTIFYFQHGEVRSRRSGLVPASEESRKSMIEWINAIGSGITPVESAYAAVDADPENVELRIKLRSELWKERRDTEMLVQKCWMLDHNNLAYEYTAKEYLANYDEQLSENEYRAGVLWTVMSMRDNLGLYRRESSYQPTTDAWADRISMVEFAERNPWRDLGSRQRKQIAQVKPLLGLRNALESRRDNKTATERDLFILMALTSEGDESRALAEKYKPYFK